MNSNDKLSISQLADSTCSFIGNRCHPCTSSCGVVPEVTLFDSSKYFFKHAGCSNRLIPLRFHSSPPAKSKDINYAGDNYSEIENV